ncbi:methionine synthase [Azospirillum ramasamyi]|uniref:Methionine synthase n=1 Tax=Azospirillum ramasamyi TaxID=682998 RepID=A0A2U9S5T9_9PROT|nr:methionine synthase [Azospirillum ramasamyi]AWU93278.1 methionine synthase [Azospirillum ramasamyi]
MPHILDTLRDRVLLCDGGFGSRIQALDLDVEKDYWGHENCTDILPLSRPDIVRDIHRGYFEAGADMVETDTFGASPVTLGEFGISEKAFEINQRAVELAREAAESFKDGLPRFVIGSIGPGTKLPSLGHIAYQPAEDSFYVQAAGLIAGGADAILVETCQDPLQIKAAVNGIKRARLEAKSDTPVFVQVTVETTGTLLVGTDIAAAATVIQALDVPLMGLNCATGPLEMSEHVRWLSQNWQGLISVQPNAGLPELVDGKTHYPLLANDFAHWLERFVTEDGVNLVGGCCGTNVPHIAAANEMLRKLAPAGSHRPAPKGRTVHWVPAVASLYSQVTLRQENAFFAIGERCNANGSKKWRELQEKHDWDGCVEMAREQVKEGSHSLDVCTAFVGRDEVAEMNAVISRFAGSVTAPLVIDSTEYKVLEQALALYGGKAILNSINFEDGEEPARKRLELAKKFGAAVIALTIDEEGMAKTPDRKLAIAKRLYDLAVNEYGLAPSDLLFDPLTFTIATGNEDDRKLAIWTLEGIEAIAREMPGCQIILGLSNVSFGLNAAARHVLNSVFLDHAVKKGMTGAIVHVSKILPLHQIPEKEVKTAEDLIFDRRAEGYDPLQAFIALFEGRKAADAKKKARAEAVEERLKERIVDGDRTGLEDDLAEAMKTHPPLEIINTYLLDGMKVVGELFGAGKMQLPFVLQSAETMKAAVAWLEPHMEKIEGQQKGTLVLATVKGDVHDIGKNLVDIILTNNGYKVINLGIKQPVTSIIQAAKEHKADAVGMSGLLVKSTVVMRENLEEMTREGLEVPVLLGGAALTRAYVEGDCVASYGSGRVAYAGDAFDGLTLMDKVVEGSFDQQLAIQQAKRAGKATNRRRVLGQATSAATGPVDKDAVRARRRRLAEGVPVPTPPFWGPKLIDHVPLKTLVTYLNERMLYQLQWGYRKDGKSFEEFKEWAKKELRPVLDRILRIAAQEEILRPTAVYGYWKAAADGNDVILFEEDGTTEAARFTMPRQAKENGECIADFLRDVTDPERDVIGLQVVTMGQHCAEVAREWFAENRYQDYLYLHGLSVEMTEAMAEYVHARIRAELGYGAEDSRDKEKLLQQAYRGSRYSFGYPACPNLKDQEQLLKLLDAGRIGIEMSDEDQLHPEQSTSAIVLHHPRAKYFSV